MSRAPGAANRVLPWETITCSTNNVISRGSTLKEISSALVFVGELFHRTLSVG